MSLRLWTVREYDIRKLYSANGFHRVGFGQISSSISIARILSPKRLLATLPVRTAFDSVRGSTSRSAAIERSLVLETSG
jgi:hypothetical protein